jgi:ABC-type sulfate transport system substrate-binding protein
VPQLHEAISEWSDIHKDEVQYVVSKVASSKEEKHNYRALLHEDQYDLFSTFSNISKISKVCKIIVHVLLH